MAIADRKEARTYFTAESDRVVVTYRSDKTEDGMQARTEFRMMMQSMLDLPLLQCAAHPQGFENMSITRLEGRWIVKLDALVPTLKRNEQ